MKNRAVRALLCGMFCVVISGATIAQVSAAPTAGVISAMAGRPASVQTTASRETSKGTADTPVTTEGETAAPVTGALTAGATTGVFASLVPATEAAAAETPTAETAAPAAEAAPAETAAPAAETAASETAAETPALEAAAPAAEEETSATGGEAAAAEDTAATETAPAAAPTTSSGVMQAMANILSETEAVPQQETSETPAAEESATGEEGTTPAEETAEGESQDAAGEAAAEEKADEYADIGIATVTDFVNVRSEASAESDAVGKLYANNALKVLDQTDDGQWYHIRSGDVDGFVSADYVSVGDEDLIKQASNRTATVHTETLFVRALPSQDSDIIGMVPDGEDLTVTDETYVDSWGWVGVSIEEGSGYVSMEFVDLDNRYTYGETKEAEEARLAKEEEERRAAAAAAEQAQPKSQKSSASSSGSSGGGGSYAAAGSGSGGSVANYALQFVGNPYVYGGSSLTNGTDCSGFVMSVYANYGVGLPHSSSAMRGVGYGVDPSQMQAGDIVCYSGHVGICIGGGQIVHASTPATGIKVSSAYYRDILAVRRIF